MLRFLGMSSPTAGERWLTFLWALLPLAYGLLAAPCMAWAAWRLCSRRLAVEATAYLALTVLWIALAAAEGTAGAIGVALALVVGMVACMRAFVVRRRLLSRQSVDAQLVAADERKRAAAGADWTPVFPAQTLRQQGHGLASIAACNGSDRHELSISVWRAIPAAVTGAGLLAINLVLHVYGRSMGVGIGLLLLPVIAVLFARWVDGPVLYYRRWGRLRELRLTDVTSVATGSSKSSRMILLSATRLDKPVRLSVQARGFVMSSAAREHLRGWLGAPDVRWTASAAALLDNGAPRSSRTGRRRLIMGLVATTVGLTAGGVGVWLEIRSGPSLAIPGAPGYSTFTGPHGKPLAVGRPWGRACQPIRLVVQSTVPGWVYDQTAAVVAEARHDGLDVTLETRQFNWSPGSLYYIDGQSPASTVPLAIFANTQTPPRLPSGQPERIQFGWDARLDPDGRNEDLTLAQGQLWMQTLDGNPQAVRRAIRQLIAMTQGILATSRHNSAIAPGSTANHFTAADTAAMKLMSGCSQTAIQR